MPCDAALPVSRSHRSRGSCRILGHVQCKSLPAPIPLRRSQGLVPLQVALSERDRIYDQSISLYLLLITKSQQLLGLPERLQLASKSLFFSRVERTHDVLLGHYRAVRINRNFRRAWRRFSRLADAELNPTVSARRAFPYPALRLW